MNKSELLAQLFDAKTVELLKHLLRKRDIFYLRDLSRETGVSLATTYRIVQKLLKIGLVKKQSHDKFTFYVLNRHSKIFNEIYALLIGTAPDPIAVLKEKLKGVKIYLLKGKDKKLFIVGEIKESDVRRALDKVYEESGEKFNFLILSQEQFDRMQNMGLIPKNVVSI